VTVVFSGFNREREEDLVSGWGCPHELDGTCQHVAGRPCDPGMKGCVLAGRYVFANEDKNTRLRQKQAQAAAAAPAPEDDAGAP